MDVLRDFEVCFLAGISTLAVLGTRSQYINLFYIFIAVLALNFFCVSLALSFKAGLRFTLPSAQDCLSIVVCSVVSVLVAYWTGL